METFLIFSITDFNNTCIDLRFVDSYNHLTSSFDGLVNSLLNKDANIQSIKNKFLSLFQHFKDDPKKYEENEYFLAIISMNKDKIN